MIIQIDIFDFDQTLFKTPLKIDWEKTYNKKWVNQDFYQSPKSFDKKLKIKPNKRIIHKFLLSCANPFVYTIIMTGRVETLRPQMEEVLNQYCLEPDCFYLCPVGYKSIDFKSEMVKKFINKNKNVKKIRFFDDRTDHLDVFIKICRDFGVECETFPVFDEHHLAKLKQMG